MQRSRRSNISASFLASCFPGLALLYRQEAREIGTEVRTSQRLKVSTGSLAQEQEEGHAIRFDIGALLLHKVSKFNDIPAQGGPVGRLFRIERQGTREGVFASGP